MYCAIRKSGCQFVLYVTEEHGAVTFDCQGLLNLPSHKIPVKLEGDTYKGSCVVGKIEYLISYSLVTKTGVLQQKNGFGDDPENLETFTIDVGPVEPGASALTGIYHSRNNAFGSFRLEIEASCGLGIQGMMYNESTGQQFQLGGSVRPWNQKTKRYLFTLTGPAISLLRDKTSTGTLAAFMAVAHVPNKTDVVDQLTVISAWATDEAKPDATAWRTPVIFRRVVNGGERGPGAKGRPRRRALQLIQKWLRRLRELRR